LHLFRKKEIITCCNCDTVLNHKYKPKPEWEIQGFLCSSCHIEKTKEFILRQQDQKEKIKQARDICVVCKKELSLESDKNKARWQWNMERNSLLCKSCFEKKAQEYEKKLNYCNLCNDILGFIRYNPKPKWNIEGQLCRKCWDKQREIRH
jgi:hypothetical protein